MQGYFKKARDSRSLLDVYSSSQTMVRIVEYDQVLSRDRPYTPVSSHLVLSMVLDLVQKRYSRSTTRTHILFSHAGPARQEQVATTSSAEKLESVSGR